MLSFFLLSRLSLLVPLLAVLAFAAAGSGSFSLSSINGPCIILAQLTTGPTPTIQAMHPICSDSTTQQQEITFPLTSAGNGASSDLLVYAQIATVAGYGGNTGKPNCVLRVPNDQLGQLFGQTLSWNAWMSGILNGPADKWLNFICEENDATLNPSFLFLPDPYQLPPTAGEFYEVIPIVAPASKRDGVADVIDTVRGRVRNRMRP